MIVLVSDAFWRGRYGEREGPFGHRWSIATHKADFPLQAIAKRAEDVFTQMAKQRRAPGPRAT